MKNLGVLVIVLIGIIVIITVLNVCTIEPRIHYSGGIAYTLSVFDVPLFVYVYNDPNTFITAMQRQNGASNGRIVQTRLQTQ